MIQLTDHLIEEAKLYANRSANYLSARNSFHDGSHESRVQKMFEGKLGEKIFKTWLLDNRIPFTEDFTSYKNADNYDFIVGGKTIDIKTKIKDYDYKILEIKDTFDTRPKDIYIAVRLYLGTMEGEIEGGVSRQKMKEINRIVNLGYGDDYAIVEEELTPIETIKDYLLKQTK